MNKKPKHSNTQVAIASFFFGLSLCVSALAIYVIAQRIAPALANIMPAAETMLYFLYALAAGSMTTYLWNNTIGSNDDLRL